MMMRPSASALWIEMSERSTARHYAAAPTLRLVGLPVVGTLRAVRGRSSAAEHQLPKLRKRVRFPSPALRFDPGHARAAPGVHTVAHIYGSAYTSPMPAALDVLEVIAEPTRRRI